MVDAANFCSSLLLLLAYIALNSAKFANVCGLI